ncbi:MAG: Asp-tRNA(Asn)/Glu-tRNA(Gln) amidotransferase subunit GatA, partial [Candidatus Moraniibacteriota bacterium]
MIRALHEKLLAKEITAVELAEGYFAQIEAQNGELNAYLTVTQESALRDAAFVDAKITKGELIGLLSGIPGAIKDNICITGVRTTAASKILDNFIAPYDATVIDRLKKENAIFLGKTNLDEFAMGASTENSAYGPARNPIDTTRVPGGSSGGSAVAVAGDMAVWALGSDTGGSIRQPASFCGIVGLKPTYGRVSRAGVIAMASSLDQVGPLTKTVEDAAIVLSAISGFDIHDATTGESEAKDYTQYLDGNVSGLRIGIPKEYFTDVLDTRVRGVAEKAIEQFRSLGAEIVPISLPLSEYALAVYYLVMPCEVSSNLARYDGIRFGLSINDAEDSIPGTSGLLETYLDTRRHGFGAEVKRRVMLGTYALSAGYYDAYYKKAQQVRRLIREDFKAAFETVDFIFSPTAPEVAFKIGDKSDDPLKMYLSDVYTVTANLVGVPAISFPIGTLETEGR